MFRPTYSYNIQKNIISNKAGIRLKHIVNKICYNVVSPKHFVLTRIASDTKRKSEVFMSGHIKAYTLSCRKVILQRDKYQKLQKYKTSFFDKRNLYFRWYLCIVQYDTRLSLIHVLTFLLSAIDPHEVASVTGIAVGTPKV